MKKQILLFFNICLSAVVSAQISVGVIGGANYAFWKFDIIDQPDINVLDFQPAFGWRAGLLAEFTLNKQLNLRAELGTQIFAHQGNRNVIFESDVLNGDFDGTEYHYRENYQFWEASVLAEVKPFRKVSWFYVVAGLNSNLLDKGWSDYNALEPDEQDVMGGEISFIHHNWRRHSFAADMGLGGNIPISKSIKLKLESRFLYFFNELDDLDNVHSRISPVMLNLGCVYQL